MLSLLGYAAQLQRDEAESRMPSQMSNVDLKAIAAEAGRLGKHTHTRMLEWQCALCAVSDKRWHTGASTSARASGRRSVVCSRWTVR